MLARLKQYTNNRFVIFNGNFTQLSSINLESLFCLTGWDKMTYVMAKSFGRVYLALYGADQGEINSVNNC